MDLAVTDITAPGLAGAPNAFVIGSVSEKVRPVEEQVSMITSRLESLANEQVAQRRPVEENWLIEVRAYHGKYDSTTETMLKDAKQSRAYVKATRAKTTALEARLFDMIFPTDDRNWDIQPTPVPKIAKELKDATKQAEGFAEKANDAEQRGEDPTQHLQQGQEQADRAMAAGQAIAAVNKAGELMREEMDDQLTESQYPQQSRDMIHDACMLGTGILKGPMVNQATRGRWLPAEGTGEYQLEPGNDPRPKVLRVDPWSFFPDMSARTIEEAEFTFERHLWSRKDLRKMVKSHSFDPNAVRRLLSDDYGRKPVTSPGVDKLVLLRSITGEGVGDIKGRWIGWEYHGPLECDEVATLMRAMGDEEGARAYEMRNDPLDEVRVICFFCNGEMLKIAPEYPMDSGDSLYSVFNVEQSESSIFGYGIPRIMMDSGTALNSAWRMALDNGSLSVGPQVIIDKDSVIPQDGSWSMTAKKVWLRVKAALKNEVPPVEFFSVPNNMDQIAAILKTALDFIDMETGIPMPQQGEQGAHTTQTVGGMAILQNAANIIFRRIVKNYDDGIITPTMRRLYDWNMQHSKRSEIKGDMSIDARGTSVLLMRELQAQNLMFVAVQLMNNPSIAPMLKPFGVIKKLFQAMMISPDDTMVTEDEWKAYQDKMAQQPPPPDPVQIQAESRVRAAEIQAESRKLDSETTLTIAQLNERTELYKLANQNKITVAQLAAQLQQSKMKINSDERKMAVEVGTERQLAEEARAAGQTPTGSGGYVSAGVEEKTTAA